MVAKITRNPVQFDFDAHLTIRGAPHLLYANLDFRSPNLRKDSRPLLKWLDLNGPFKWEGDYRRTLHYLGKHQERFRDCLEWITEGCPVDFTGDSKLEVEDENTQSESRAKWEDHPPLRFFRQHIFLHGRVTFEPEWQEFSRLSGLRLTQRKSHDPLDPICWHVLSMFVHWGTVFVRRCRYWFTEISEFIEVRLGTRNKTPSLPYPFHFHHLLWDWEY